MWPAYTWESMKAIAQRMQLLFFKMEVVNSTEFLTKEPSSRPLRGGIPSFLPDRAKILGDLRTFPYHLFLFAFGLLVVSSESGEDA